MRARPWSRPCRSTSTRSTGEGVHVVTVNDYLAKYHAEWMGRIYHFLGLSVGMVLPQMSSEARRDVVPVRHHLRHQQRVRLRLPARQHGQPDRGLRPARPPLRDRRRGRLDPDRRGPDAADHLRPVRRGGQVVRRVRQAGRPAAHRRRLRGRREEAHRLGARGRHHPGRGPPRHRQPLRRGQHPADLLPQQRDQGQGAVPHRPRLRRHRGRGADRRRAHRPHAARPSLQRGPAPGDRGQGGRARSARSTRPSRRSPCRTTSGSTRSSAA